MTTTRPRDTEPDDAERLQEEDEGYGASHGYGPGHGGPSGPGDAPAKGRAAKPPAEPDDEMMRPSEKAP